MSEFKKLSKNSAERILEYVYETPDMTLDRAISNEAEELKGHLGSADKFKNAIQGFVITALQKNYPHPDISNAIDWDEVTRVIDRRLVEELSWVDQTSNITIDQEIYDDITPGDKVYVSGNTQEGWFIVKDLDDVYVLLDGFDMSHQVWPGLDDPEALGAWFGFEQLEDSEIIKYDEHTASEDQKTIRGAWLDSFPNTADNQITAPVYSVDIKWPEEQKLETVLITKCNPDDLLDFDTRLPGSLTDDDIFFYGLDYTEIIKTMQEGGDISGDGWTIERYNGPINPGTGYLVECPIFKDNPLLANEEWQKCFLGNPGQKQEPFPDGGISLEINGTKYEILLEVYPNEIDGSSFHLYSPEQGIDTNEWFDTAGQVERFFADPRNFLDHQVDPFVIIKSHDSMNLSPTTVGVVHSEGTAPTLEAEISSAVENSKAYNADVAESEQDHNKNQIELEGR